MQSEGNPSAKGALLNDVVMPEIGVSMDEGTLARWLKQPGDAVAAGEAIAEIETDKAAVELESPADGVLGRHLVAEGATALVGQALVRVLAPGEDEDAAQAPAPRPSPQPASAARGPGRSARRGGSRRPRPRRPPAAARTASRRAPAASRASTASPSSRSAAPVAPATCSRRSPRPGAPRRGGCGERLGRAGSRAPPAATAT